MLEPVKALAIVVLTRELIRFAGGDGADLFGRGPFGVVSA
jgi:hypothetical protein